MRFARPKPSVVVTPALCLLAGPAWAHGGNEITGQTALSAWRMTPSIVIPLAAVIIVYLVGAWRRRNATRPIFWWRHALFFGGATVIFLALQSPLDPIAEHLFFVHQIQHLALRMLGPMLLALAHSEGLLTVGLPTAARRRVLAPVVSAAWVRAMFGFLWHPVVVTFLFIAALYLWEWPAFHDLALWNETVHDFMHATMLLAGMLFWWRIFERRAPLPQPTETLQPPSRRGLGYGARLMMLWIVILSNILLGAPTALKDTVLYPAYDTFGRFFDVGSLQDELIGGVIIWIPSSMMCLIAILIVLHLWGLEENRIEKRGHGAASASVAVLRQRNLQRNRSLAIGLGGFAGTVFLSAVMVVIVAHILSQTGLGFIRASF